MSSGVGLEVGRGVSCGVGCGVGRAVGCGVSHGVGLDVGRGVSRGVGVYLISEKDHLYSKKKIPPWENVSLTS